MQQYCSSRPTVPSLDEVTQAIGLAQALGAKLTAFYAAPDYPLPMYADGVVYEPVSKRKDPC